MRPVLKDATLLKNYLATFDHTGDGRQTVVVYQAVWNRGKGDPVVKFFRNGTPIPPETGSATNAKPRTVPVNRRDGTTPLTVQAILQPYRQAGRQPLLRVLLDVDVATELLRVLYEDKWYARAKNKRLFFPQAPPEVATALIAALGVDKPKAYSADYGEAKPELGKALGVFCSYCESPLQNARDLDVEHRLPKSCYPTEMLRWENFVLGCSLCNRDIKRARPSRQEGITALAGGQPPTGNKVPPYTRYHDIRERAERLALWPDVVASQTISMIRYALCEWVTNRWKDIGTARAFDVNSGTEWTTTAEQRIRTQIVSSTGFSEDKDVMVCARVRRRDLSLIATEAAAKYTIELVGLNDVTKPGNDRRMVARTEAWLKALRAVRRINGLQPGTELNEAWQSAVESALHGFYSVWVTVFKHAGNQAKAEELVNRLQAAALADPHNRARYRGTDVNSVTTSLPNL